MKIEINEKRAQIALIVFMISGVISKLLDLNYPDKRLADFNSYNWGYFFIESVFALIVVISLTYLILQIMFLLILRKRKQKEKINNV